MTEPLHGGRRTGWPLRGVHPLAVVSEIQWERGLIGQRRQLERVGHDADSQSAGICEIDRDPAQALGEGHDRTSDRVRQSQHVGRVGCPEGWTDEPRPRASADEHAGRAGVCTAQLQFVCGAERRRKTEGMGERLRPLEVGLLELQPREVMHLDDRLGGPPPVFARQGALLTVQTGMRVMVDTH